MVKISSPSTFYESIFQNVLDELTSNRHSLSIDERQWEECGICLANELVEDEREWEKTACNHTFHSLCLNNWFHVCKDSEKDYSCPMCRSVILTVQQMTPDEEYEEEEFREYHHDPNSAIIPTRQLSIVDLLIMSTTMDWDHFLYSIRNTERANWFSAPGRFAPDFREPGFWPPPT